jgi:hypothetical protein
VPVVRLTEIFRQASQSRIVTAAYAINQGRMPTLSKPEELTDFYFVEADEPEAIQDMLVRLVKERIPARFGCDPKTDIQVLAPMNRSLLGARNLNQVLQAALNPGDGGPEIERFGWTFRIGDRVIQTENNYDRDVFNGDLGVVEKINRIEQEIVVNFEGRPVKYDFADLDELALAYVLSIHKSQGSEFSCVVIPLHTQHLHDAPTEPALHRRDPRHENWLCSWAQKRHSAWPCGGRIRTGDTRRRAGAFKKKRQCPNHRLRNSTGNQNFSMAMLGGFSRVAGHRRCRSQEGDTRCVLTNGK